jgi:superfamily II DNA/RNA helicase
MSFDQLGLHASLTQAVAHAGYAEATEVQRDAIPPALAGADLMVSSCTGSGKTASFILPALQRVLNARAEAAAQRAAAPGALEPVRRDGREVRRGARVLVLVPTRELALQVSKAAETYGRGVKGLRIATVVGGVPYPAQIAALRAGPDILISTPGRLLDHIQSGRCELGHVELLVLDEADRMLDLGFIDDINIIAGHVPATRQTMMYSATFAGNVGNLARHLLRDPKRIAVTSHTQAHVNIEQRLHWADNHNHKNALLDHILTQRELEQALVFTSTQRDADWLADRLADLGHSVASLHGGMPQGRRNRVLQGLRSRRLRVLVATDVAARGIDVPGISHVINYGMPMKAEDYVHRIGRTGRAGRNGLAVTLAERNDTDMVRRIQSFTTQPIPVTTIGGLEPKNPQPQVKTFRASGRPGDAPPARSARPRGNAFVPRKADAFSARGAARPAIKPFGNGSDQTRTPHGEFKPARKPVRTAHPQGGPGDRPKAFVPR